MQGVPTQLTKVLPVTNSNPYAGLGVGQNDVTIPTQEDFVCLAQNRSVVPVVRKLALGSDSPMDLYIKLTNNLPGSFLLESAEHGRKWSRYSFIGVRCQATLSERNGEAIWVGDIPDAIDATQTDLATVGQVLTALHSERIKDLPPLTSGLVGYLAYDIVRRWEDLPVATSDDLQLPEFMLFLVTDLAIMDHEENQIILVSNVFANPTQSKSERLAAYDEAVNRLNRMEKNLDKQILIEPISGESDTASVAKMALSPVVTSNTSAAEYLDKVETVREYIRAGDAFQVVVSQRFECETQSDAIEVYRALRDLNPSPYMYLFRIPELRQSNGRSNPVQGFSIVGSSPEALVKLEDGKALLHPIAGTRPRSSDKAQDDALAEELLADTKERAEHLMLVDLGRNDLGRVCQPGSVEVTEFMNVERYSHVMHIVSTVTGELKPQLNAFDLLVATHPAGTLSGAPKVRAMEIIEELETTRRGVYAGCVGYFDFAGDMDAAIAIRTAVLRNNKAYVQAGAGLVADSVPQTEYEECQNKAAAVFRAIAAAANLSPIQTVADPQLETELGEHES